MLTIYWLIIHSILNCYVSLCFVNVNVGSYKLVNILIHILERGNKVSYYTLTVVKQPKRHFLYAPTHLRVWSVIKLTNNHSKSKLNYLTCELWISCTNWQRLFKFIDTIWQEEQRVLFIIIPHKSINAILKNNLCFFGRQWWVIELVLIKHYYPRYSNVKFCRYWV